MHTPDSHHAPLLTIEDTMLKYGDAWTVDLYDIRVIGEFTTPVGPVSPDYFIAFIDRNGRRHEAPAEALSRPVVDQLRAILGPFEFRLASQTALDSSIMWPLAHAGDKLYTFTPAPARSFGDRIRHLLGAQTMNVALTEDTQAAMRGRSVLDTPVAAGAFARVAVRH